MSIIKPTNSNPYYIINERHEVVESGRAVPGAEIIPGRDEMLVWGEAPDITAKQAEATPYRIRDADGFVRTGAGAVPDYELGHGESIEYAAADEPLTKGGEWNILQEAQEAVYGDRERDYGHPRDDFGRIAIRWRAHILAKYGVALPIDVVDVAGMMSDVKRSRLDKNPMHRDSYTDWAGYAAAGARAVGVDA